VPKAGEALAVGEGEAVGEGVGEFSGTGVGVPNGVEEGEAAARKRGASKLNDAAETIFLKGIFDFMATNQ
jgi:hypothetical protein